MVIYICLNHVIITVIITLIPIFEYVACTQKDDLEREWRLHSKKASKPLHLPPHGLYGSIEFTDPVINLKKQRYLRDKYHKISDVEQMITVNWDNQFKFDDDSSGVSHKKTTVSWNKDFKFDDDSFQTEANFHKIPTATTTHIAGIPEEFNNTLNLISKRLLELEQPSAETINVKKTTKSLPKRHHPSHNSFVIHASNKKVSKSHSKKKKVSKTPAEKKIETGKKKEKKIRKKKKTKLKKKMFVTEPASELSGENNNRKPVDIIVHIKMKE